VGTRRDFLRLAGLGGIALALPSFLTACNEDPIVPNERATFDLSKDIGVLNVAYAIAQFQYAFYQYVTFTPYVGATTLEAGSPITSVFGHFQSQPQSYKLVYSNTLGMGQITNVMEFNFDAIDFSSRSSVFAFAEALEDKTTDVYVTLLSLCKSADALTFLSKIASVQARRAATIHDLADIAAGNADTAARTSFAGDAIVPPTTGLEPTLSVTEYIDFMRPYSVTTLTITGA
jgi:hypothetical protein